MSEVSETKVAFSFGAGVTTIVLLAILFGMWGCPRYSVYQAQKSGQAKLAEAQSSKQVQIADALGKKESAQLLADAEVIRAGGLANAIKAVKEQLGGNPTNYIKWLWIQKLGENNQHIIYVPTEAGMPILEAGRGTQTMPLSPIDDYYNNVDQDNLVMKPKK